MSVFESLNKVNSTVWVGSRQDRSHNPMMSKQKRAETVVGPMAFWSTVVGQTEGDQPAAM